ncbi:MAG TPA: hypothetical protein VFE89_15415, partial [Beijerinckiaceae bacterium]|nr:hypothetical protein [Beijerinckiaceae bacterium]
MAGLLEARTVLRERFGHAEFRPVAMVAALRAAHPQIMAIDEAHCIAHWGHDFRPEYGKLRKAADAIGARQIVAVTVTATPPTRAEIIDTLFRSPPQVFAGSFERPNLANRVERRRPRAIAAPGDRSSRASRNRGCRIDRHVRQGIAEPDVARLGFNALSYHAGLDGGRAPICRQQMLLRALGDDGLPCGRCDNCRK